VLEPIRRALQGFATALYASAALASTSAAQQEAQETEAELGASARVQPSSREPDRAHSTVTRQRLDEIQPRSAPDALRFEPGVSVQQTAHGQASPYVRGMTGQQVVHVFDGVRMNNGIFRQGPNQYFFTVDSYTLGSLEVVRGSSSTLYGSDALGGAILAFPRDPSFGTGTEPLEWHPRLFGRFASADLERGGRAEFALALRDHTALLAGAGLRETERLESGGVVRNPGARAPLVPRFEADGRTQLGTGFREATFDTRVVQRIAPTLQVVAALYGYRQFDAPRTDQCPPPEAPISECLRIEEQFRTLAYASLRGSAGAPMHDFDMNVSYQRHDELRVNDRPRSYVQNAYDNRVFTLGASFRAQSAQAALPGGGRLTLHYGAEAYRDEVASGAVQTLTDPQLQDAFEPDELRFIASRGQYLDGSVYVNTGLFTQLQVVPIDMVTLSAGGRVAAIGANVPEDPESGSAAATPRWTAAVGRAGVAVQAHEDVRLHLNFDQGFRAPNLDDLTSRQQVGPGFQFENATLEPERTNTLEFGVTSTPSVFVIEGWVFSTWLDHAITRTVRDPSDCPADSDTCRSSRTPYQLVNASGNAQLLGAEGMITIALPFDVTLRATAAYAFGEGPNTGSRAVAGVRPFGERVPLSRVPPLNGSAEARYGHRGTGLYAAAVVRWALAQDRLAPIDLSDARIPPGGTPGYAACDLRAGWRYAPHLRLNLVFENVFDAAYRVHGSSINGPGRGVLLGAALSY
jgi:outer membrane receptor protein involved in Fe transport